MFDKQAPGFLTQLTPACNEVYHKRCNENGTFICFNDEFFKADFFPWNIRYGSISN